MRKFHDEVVYPDAQAREEDGKRPSLEVIQKMAYVLCSVLFDTRQDLCEWFETREVNLHAMRSGPGKHLKGLTLLGGVVTPEEVCLATILPPSARADRFLCY